MKNDAFTSKQGMPLCTVAPYLEIRGTATPHLATVPSDLSHKSQLAVQSTPLPEPTPYPLLQHVALHDVLTTLLIRDRLFDNHEQIAQLANLIQSEGLYRPILLQQTPEGLELVQGARRLAAYRHLYAQTRDPKWLVIRSNIMPFGTSTAALYRLMIVDNLVQGDLSYAEKALVAMNYAADPDTRTIDINTAVDEVFEVLPNQHRCIIRDFCKVMDRIGDALIFPAAIPATLGQRLAHMLTKEPQTARQIRRDLTDRHCQNAAQEVRLLTSYVGGQSAPAN